MIEWRRVAPIAVESMTLSTLEIDPIQLKLIPPPPTAADVAIPQSPRPPELGPVGPEGVTRAQIVLLIQAYRACVAARGLKTFVYAPNKLPADITRIKDYAVLEAAYRALEGHEIQPHPWCSFQFNAYNHARRAAGEASRVPAIGYVYSVELIDKRRGWYRSERDQHCLIRSAVPEALIQLRATYAEMEAEIAATPLRDRTREFYADLRARYFPGKAYSSALAQARMQAAISKQAMDAAVAAGEWVWE